MRAFILAAGRGERMKPLTNNVPKPLLTVGGKSLLEHLLEKLRSAGIKEFIINTAYLGHMIHEKIGDGTDFGVNIRYSQENEPLETAGAINQAMALLGKEVFLLVNGDIWTDYDFAGLMSRVDETKAFKREGAHLVLVENPSHNRSGDFVLEQGVVKRIADSGTGYTFGGISLISPAFIKNYPRKREKFALREVLYWGIEKGKVSGEVFPGSWMDVGTPERLALLERQI